jgi:hypothetical protein
MRRKKRRREKRRAKREERKERQSGTMQVRGPASVTRRFVHSASPAAAHGGMQPISGRENSKPHESAARPAPGVPLAADFVYSLLAIYAEFDA